MRHRRIRVRRQYPTVEFVAVVGNSLHRYHATVRRTVVVGLHIPVPQIFGFGPEPFGFRNKIGIHQRITAYGQGIFRRTRQAFAPSVAPLGESIVRFGRRLQGNRCSIAELGERGAGLHPTLFRIGREHLQGVGSRFKIHAHLIIPVHPDARKSLAQGVVLAVFAFPQQILQGKTIGGYHLQNGFGEIGITARAAHTARTFGQHGRRKREFI